MEKTYRKIRDGEQYNAWKIGDVFKYYKNPDPEYWEEVKEEDLNHLN